MKIQIIAQPIAVGVPGGNDIEYSGKINRKMFFVVFRPTKDWDYTKFRAFIGPKDDLREVAVYYVDRFRDGGTTNIKTEAGDFRFPSLFNKNEFATFKKKKIEVFPKQ